MSNRLAHVLDAKWRSDDVNTNEEIDFSSLDLDERILTGLWNAGYRIPSPVQLQAIPLCLTGDDVFFQGKSGTGKTLVFSILAVTAVLEAEDLEVLIIAPTREGAFQIHNTICAIGSEVDLKCEYFIGGFSYDEDIPKARECKIAVGTPGRLLHLIQEDKLKIDTIRLFIIDDFDELLNKHLKPEVSDIFYILPEKKQTVVASLTCTDEVMELTSEFLKHPFLTCCNENEPSLLGMAHYYYIVPINCLPLLSYRRKLEVLKSVLFRVKFSQCIIFCNSVHRIEPLCIDIKMWGFSVVSISKAKDQVERLQAIELLKKNKCRILVSTDVTSRGLDAENVDLVVNFDMPSTCRAYLHRCGRAGRYGAKCSSITFLLKNQTEQFDKIENEGHFNSYALPEPIPEDLHYKLRTTCNSKEDFLASSTESNRTAVSSDLEKITAGEGCSQLISNENGDKSLEVVDKGYSVLIADEIEEQAIDLNTVNTTHLMGDFEMIQLENDQITNTNQHLEVFECKSSLLNGSLESLRTYSGSKTSEIETEQHLKKTDPRNKFSSSDEIGLCTASKTVQKSAFKSKCTSKMSEEYLLHKEFDNIPLETEENCSKKVTKIPQMTRKKSYKNIRNTCNKKSGLSNGQEILQSPERQVSFYGINTSSSEFDANQSCTTFHPRHPPNHLDVKKVDKKCKMLSTRGKYRGSSDRLSQTRNFNVQRNPRPSRASSRHCCHFPNNYCQPPFLLHREDMFYKQWMFINNFSYFLSHFV